MTKTFLFALPHSVVVVCEILVVLAVIAAGGITYGLARLAQGPVDVGFAKKYIEDTLSGGGQMIAVNVTRATLSWPNMTGPILLDLKGLSITDQGRDVADVQDISLAVAKLPLLVGRIRPERLILNNPTVTVVRDPSNRMRMDLGTVDVGRVQMSGGASVGLGGVMAYVLGDDRAALGVLSHIDQIEIRQARIRVIDERLGMTWQLPRVAVTLQNVDVGVMGTATIQLLNGQTLDARVSYQRENDVLIFDGRFRDFSLPAFAGRLMGAEWVRRQHLPMTGAVKIVAGLKTPRLQSISVDATADQGTMDLGSEIGVQVPVRDFVLKLAYQHDQDSWDIPQLDFVAADIPVRAKLDLSPVKDHGVRGDLVVQIDSLAQQKLAELWPKTARDTPVARWVLDKISRVQFRDIAVTVPVVANMNNRQLTLLALHPRATWAFRGLDLNYRPPLPVLTDARGTGVYENDALEISVAGGVIHGLDVTGSTVRIDDLAKAGAGQAHLDLTLKGPVKDALDYIATDPIAIKDRLPIKTDAVKGQGDIHAVVTFPTLKDLPKDLIEADVTTTLRDITVPNVAGGLDLTGGPFDVAVVDGMASFKGAGAFGGQPITIDWAEPMSMGAGKSGARGRVTVETNDAMRTALGAAFDGVQGLMPVTLDYKAGAKNTATVAVKVDLTPARLNIREFGYEKVPGQKASAALTLGLQNGAVKTAKNVTITAPRLSVSSGALTFGQIGTQRTIVRASVPRLKLGASDASVLYTRDAKNMDVTIKGKRFDLGPFLSTKGDSTSAPAFQLTADVDALGFGADVDLQGAHLNIAIDENADIDRLKITGTAGQAPVDVQYASGADGRMALSVVAANAGAFLRTLNVYENMRGGTLHVNATPVGSNRRDVKGRLVIKDFSVVKAPILAQLLGAMSLQGIGDQLTNQGIGFERLQAGFALERRAGHDVMTFRDGRTSGSALGLTFDGVYDRRAGRVDVAGTIIPASGLNTFASRIPVIGELLVGGRGSALFAATYAIKGPVDSPKTSINPLAVLTPGILRKIFFEGEPDVGDAAEGRDTAPREPAANKGYN